MTLIDLTIATLLGKPTPIQDNVLRMGPHAKRLNAESLNDIPREGGLAKAPVNNR